MREYGIGHLYPGATVEYEEDMKRSMASGGVEGGVEAVQALYSSLKYNEIKASSRKREDANRIKELLAFIEAKGFPAKELQDWLYQRAEKKFLADEGLETEENNLQTQSLEDASNKPR